VSDDIALEGLVLKAVTFSSSCGTVDSNDLAGLVVHDGDDREREGVKVGIVVVLALVGGEAQTLEESLMIIGEIATTIWPGLNDQFEAFWEVELSQGGLEERRGHARLDQLLKLGPGPEG
jgi:hypothetical protein